MIHIKPCINDTVIIAWLLNNRKGIKERLDNIDMPFIQLSQEAAVSILQACSVQIAGGMQGTIDACLLRSG